VPLQFTITTLTANRLARVNQFFHCSSLFIWGAPGSSRGGACPRVPPMASPLARFKLQRRRLSFEHCSTVSIHAILCAAFESTAALGLSSCQLFTATFLSHSCRLAKLQARPMPSCVVCPAVRRVLCRNEEHNIVKLFHHRVATPF